MVDTEYFLLFFRKKVMVSLAFQKHQDNEETAQK